MMHYEIDDNFYITHVTPYMAEELYKVVDSNRAHLRAWLPWIDSNTGPDHTLAFIEESLEKFAQKKAVTWIICYHGVIVGIISIFNIDWNTRSGEIGYWLAKTATGQGVITRCLIAVEEVAFRVLELEKLEIQCAEGNTPSRRIPEKTGYLREGTLRRAGHLYGQVVDHVVYGKLKDEWQKD